MTTTFTTESGSTYEVDLAERRYRKVTTSPDSFVPTFPWTKFITLKSRCSVNEAFEDDDAITVGRQYRFATFMDWARTGFVTAVGEVGVAA